MYYILLILFCLFGCEKPQKTVTTPTIVVSIPPYAYIVKRLCGDEVNVETVVPVGSNPHIFEPRPSDLAKMQNVKLWISIGEGYEKKIFSVIQKRSPALARIDFSEDATICSDHDHDHSHDHSHFHEHDIHFWLSPLTMKKQAEEIYKTLVALSPENREIYAARWNALENDLVQTHQTTLKILEAKQNQTILVSHGAFAYFCQDYNLNQLSIETDGKEPLARHMQDISKTIHEQKIRMILVQPQNSDKGALALSRNCNLSLVEVDPYAEDYLVNIKKIAEIIANDR